MRNKKGEVKGGLVAMIVVAFIGVVVGLTLMQGQAVPVGEMTNLVVASNTTLTAAAVNGTVNAPGRENTTAIIITNSTSGTVISTNFTVINTDSGGNLDVLIKTTDLAASYANRGINVSYTFKPNGFVNDPASQGIAQFILTMSGIALVAWLAGLGWQALGIGK